MSKFYDMFYDRTVQLFRKANELDKPMRSDVTWTFGLINGRDDYLDLQCHALALAASIIINEPMVPKIICSWDTKNDYFSLKKKDKHFQFPVHVMAAFPEWKGFPNDILSLYDLNTRYFKLYRSAFSVNSFPNTLGLGYRAKYHGLNIAKTPYGVLSDIDTVCINPCLDNVMMQVNKLPEIFCWSNYKDRIAINAGFCVFNMKKYFEYYLPAVMGNCWILPNRDSEILKFLQCLDPVLKRELTISVLKDKSFIAEKYYYSKRRDDLLDEKTCLYHAWKGDARIGNDKFYDFYNEILIKLETKIKKMDCI